MTIKRFFLIILGILLVAILVFVGIMTSMQNSFLKDLPDQFVEVGIFEANSQEYAIAPLHKDDSDPKGQEEFEKFGNALGDTSFRRILGLPEWQFRTAPKFVLDSEGDKQQVFRKELIAMQADSDQYMIDLYWGFENIQELEVQGETIKFDTLKIMLGDSSGRIMSVRAYAYVSTDFVGNNQEDIDDNFVYPFDFYANTTNLYKTIGDIIKS